MLQKSAERPQLNPVILCVDDEKNVLEGISRVLHAEPFTVLTATSGLQALNILKQFRVDVIVSDEQMPEMSGTELMEITSQVYPGILRIILTGKADIESMKRAINQGNIDRYLTKPVPVRVLCDTIMDGLHYKKYEDGALQKAIFNSSYFSSIATDAKGVIQIFNVGAEQMLGYSAAEVENKLTPADISDPQEVIARAKALSDELSTPIAPGIEALVFKASRGIEDIYELTYIRKDGSRFPAIVSVTALRDDKDGIIGYLLIGTDNTLRKRDEELRHQIERIIQHDIRSPACNAISIAKILCDDINLTDEQHHLIGLFEQSGQNMLDTLDCSIYLYKIETGQYNVTSKKFDALNLILSVLKGLSLPMDKRRVTTEVKLNGLPLLNTHCICRGEPKLLRTAFQNILKNAIEASPPDHPIHVNFTEGECLTIAIGNKGVVPIEIRNRFFDK